MSNHIFSICKKCGLLYTWKISDMNHVDEDSELEYDYERAKALWSELQPSSGKKLSSICHRCAGRPIRLFISRHCKSGVTYE